MGPPPRGPPGRCSSTARSASTLLVDAVRDYAIFMLDPQGHVVSWNAGAQRIKGYGAEEIVGQHFSRFYPPEDVAAGKPGASSLRAAAERGASRRRAGGSARTARASGPT